MSRLRISKAIDALSDLLAASGHLLAASDPAGLLEAAAAAIVAHREEIARMKEDIRILSAGIGLERRAGERS